ncbi:MAG: rhodanese-like domain-containing protein [Burkholderiales bacterium]|nr:MAG: rhodanese-like domain-containing protein [Burkholderiales bacterium]
MPPTIAPTTASPGVSTVASIPAAPPAAALAHFEALLAHETDCADVQADLAAGTAAFVLLDVRGPAAYARGHVAGAVSLPHRGIDAARMAEWPEGTLFVVYCAGPHCNGADRAALRLARLGRPVKKMIGGVTGWLDEGFRLAADDGASRKV